MMSRPSKMTVNLKLKIRPAPKSMTSVCRMKRKLHTHRTVRMMLPKILLNPLLTKFNSFQGGYATDKTEGSGPEPVAMYCSPNTPRNQLFHGRGKPLPWSRTIGIVRACETRCPMGIVDQQGFVGFDAFASGRFCDVREQEWRGGRAANTLFFRQLQGFLGGGFQRARFHGVCFWYGTADDQPMQLALPLGAGDSGDGCHVVNAVAQASAAGAHVEGGELVGLPAKHRHALSLQVL